MYLERHSFELYFEDRELDTLNRYFSYLHDEAVEGGDDCEISYARRFRSMAIRLSMILTTMRCFETNQTGGEYPIDSECLDLVLSFCDYLNDQACCVMKMLPEVSSPEIKEKRSELLENLPCHFSFATGMEYAKQLRISQSTFKRDLNKWIEKGDIKKESHNEYTKTGCGAIYQSA